MLYRLLFLCLGLTLITAAGCNNSEDECDTDGQLSLDDYIAQNAPMALTASEGVRYEILDAGSSRRPSETATVEVAYTGYLTDGRQFDSSNGRAVTFPLQNLVRGWQIGIPLVGEGGSIRLFLPPEVGYGSRSIGIICPNSPLIFDIDLVSFTE